MNLIQRQAKNFYESREEGTTKGFVNSVKNELYEYRKTTYKIQFLEFIVIALRKDFDDHSENCSEKWCDMDMYYESAIFFLQEELEALEGTLPYDEFSRLQKNETNKTLQLILKEVNQLKHGQQITYDDFSEEFEELKDLYFLNKKNWLENFTGKISNMIASGMISETYSKSIIEIMKKHYEQLIQNPT